MIEEAKPETQKESNHDSEEEIWESEEETEPSVSVSGSDDDSDGGGVTGVDDDYEESCHLTPHRGFMAAYNNSSSKKDKLARRGMPGLKSKMYVGTQDKYIHYHHNLYSSFLYRGRLTRAEKTRRRDRLGAQDVVSMVQMEKHLAKSRATDKVLFGRLTVMKK